MRNEGLKGSWPRPGHVHGVRALCSGAAVVLLSVLAACAKDGAAKPPHQDSAATVNGGPPAVLATVGDERITMEDVKGRVGPALERIEFQYQRARSKMIDSALQMILTERVLQVEAKKEGKTAEELLAAEAGASLEPNDVEIAAWYQENQIRLQGRTLDQLRPQIADYLRDQHRKQAAQKLEQRLNEQLKVKVNFTPFRLTFANEGAPTLGKKGAPVTLVEFSDFQCPYCQRFAPTLKRVEQEFGDKVYIVYRQYPIPSLHPNAFKAAEASLCANEQGKFWQIYDLMFGEQDRLDVTNLKEKAKRLGMNQQKFNSCLDAGRYVEQVQNDQKEGARSGITGTPAVFINGTELQGGAVSYDVVRDAIQKELTRAQRSN
jgi:protein-disulfide isomerase